MNLTKRLNKLINEMRDPIIEFYKKQIKINNESSILELMLLYKKNSSVYGLLVLENTQIN